MNLVTTIKIPDDLATQLEDAARTRGVDVVTYVIDVLKKELEHSREPERSFLQEPGAIQAMFGNSPNRPSHDGLDWGDLEEEE